MRVLVWDVETSDLRPQTSDLRPQTSEVCLLCICVPRNPKPPHAWPGSRDMRVLVWDAETAEVVQTLEGHKYQVRCLVLIMRSCMGVAQAAPS